MIDAAAHQDADYARRARMVAWWAGFALYLAIAFGGAVLFARFVHDGEWRNIFYSVWWLPAGAVSLWLKNRLEDFAVRWVRRP